MVDSGLLPAAPLRANEADRFRHMGDPLLDEEWLLVARGSVRFDPPKSADRLKRALASARSSEDMAAAAAIMAFGIKRRTAKQNAKRSEPSKGRHPYDRGLPGREPGGRGRRRPHRQEIMLLVSTITPKTMRTQSRVLVILFGRDGALAQRIPITQRNFAAILKIYSSLGSICPAQLRTCGGDSIPSR